MIQQLFEFRVHSNFHIYHDFSQMTNCISHQAQVEEIPEECPKFLLDLSQGMMYYTADLFLAKLKVMI